MTRAITDKPKPRKRALPGSQPDRSTLGLNDASQLALAHRAEAGETLRCPTCGRRVESLRCGHCGSHLPGDCLLEDPGFLARAVGKQLSRLEGGKALGLTTPKNVRALGGDDRSKDNGAQPRPLSSEVATPRIRGTTRLPRLRASANSSSTSSARITRSRPSSIHVQEAEP